MENEERALMARICRRQAELASSLEVRGVLLELALLYDAGDPALSVPHPEKADREKLK